MSKIVVGLLPVALFLVIALVVAFIARRQGALGGGRKREKGGSFVSEYFLGSRSLGA